MARGRSFPGCKIDIGCRNGLLLNPHRVRGYIRGIHLGRRDADPIESRRNRWWNRSRRRIGWPVRHDVVRPERSRIQCPADLTRLPVISSAWGRQNPQLARPPPHAPPTSPALPAGGAAESRDADAPGWGAAGRSSVRGRGLGAGSSRGGLGAGSWVDPRDQRDSGSSQQFAPLVYEQDRLEQVLQPLGIRHPGRQIPSSIVRRAELARPRRQQAAPPPSDHTSIRRVLRHRRFPDHFIPPGSFCWYR